MNVLILGGGGREHALAWKIAQSPLLNKLFVAPGNAGTGEVAQNLDVDVNDFKGIAHIIEEKAIDLLIVGPEAPLVGGIKDFFKQDSRFDNLSVFGPDKMGAKLEGSKDWAKSFMEKHNIPTASYKTFFKNELNQAFDYLEHINPPYVLKADGLAGGKGVVICENLQKAREELKAMLNEEKFGDASRKVVIEEFLSGIELSVFVITDGSNYKILPAAKDYKRVGEGDTGLNTGGMGSVSPVPFVDKEFMDKVEKRIIKPTIDGLKHEKIDYNGFIFFGLMNVANNPFIIEYNVRMGDPEAESIIPRIDSDLLELINASADKTLEEKSIEIDTRYSVAVMLTSGGYPGKYEKGKVIKGIDDFEDGLVFHAGTKQKEQVITSGGRVIAVNGIGASLEKALRIAYQGCELIDFDGKYYRKDLGQDLKQYIK